MTVVLPPIPASFVTTLPQLDATAIAIQWHCAFYDGPHDGVLRYHTLPCWFRLRDDAATFGTECDADGQPWHTWYARFIVIALTQEQYAQLHTQNELFRTYVGTHWDYDQQGKRTPGHVRPQAQWQVYYDTAATWPPIDLTHNPVLGWVEWLWTAVEVDSEE